MRFLNRDGFVAAAVVVVSIAIPAMAQTPGDSVQCIKPENCPGLNCNLPSTDDYCCCCKNGAGAPYACRWVSSTVLCPVQSTGGQCP